MAIDESTNPRSWFQPRSCRAFFEVPRLWFRRRNGSSVSSAPTDVDPSLFPPPQRLPDMVPMPEMDIPFNYDTINLEAIAEMRGERCNATSDESDGDDVPPDVVSPRTVASLGNMAATTATATVRRPASVSSRSDSTGGCEQTREEAPEIVGSGLGCDKVQRGNVAPVAPIMPITPRDPPSLRTCPVRVETGSFATRAALMAPPILASREPLRPPVGHGLYSITVRRLSSRVSQPDGVRLGWWAKMQLWIREQRRKRRDGQEEAGDIGAGKGLVDSGAGVYPGLGIDAVEGAGTEVERSDRRDTVGGDGDNDEGATDKVGRCGKASGDAQENEQVDDLQDAEHQAEQKWAGKRVLEAIWNGLKRQVRWLLQM